MPEGCRAGKVTAEREGVCMNLGSAFIRVRGGVPRVSQAHYCKLKALEWEFGCGKGKQGHSSVN